MRKIRISIAKQHLELIESGQVVGRFAVSTALLGAGELRDSFKTPRGLHCVRARIGSGLRKFSILVGRRPTGELWSPELSRRFPDRDFILTRVLWLSGLEPGRNRLGQVDSMRRFIYIHGAPETMQFGKPGSRGCIRVTNEDVMEIFEWSRPGEIVEILE